MVFDRGSIRNWRKKLLTLNLNHTLKVLEKCQRYYFRPSNGSYGWQGRRNVVEDWSELTIERKEL